MSNAYNNLDKSKIIRTMTLLFNCGLCCIIISAWGFLQLAIMGIFLKLEVTAFLDDVVAEEYTDYDDFIKKTRENYSLLAVNCWIAAGIYAVMIAISYFCIMKAGRNERKQALRTGDDDVYCENKSKVI